MHLKTLTVRGFKSFAGATTFRFEPGMTAVVGPNGSGKSNVVDAIAWVLGEQGAKALRGGQMSDVIFAGTPERAALGRAEVTLTIDNTDGALAVDYTEVSISRLMYRSGDSEYAINGTPCRLLDVQELMSDSGIGRELHVIVGQGQLDAVLNARPEERRAFIEEAAGVLKHRKRKEKALRKLEATSANLARLTDLTTELRRQLGPLGRQAEVARRAGSIQAALRDARLRLLADDLTTLRQAHASDVADEQSALARRAAVDTALEGSRQREAILEAAVAAATPALTSAQDTYYQLAGLGDRLRGLAALAQERARHLAAPVEERTGRAPEELLAEAADARAAETTTAESLRADRDRLELAIAARQQVEAALPAAEAAQVAAARAAADRREGLARLAGEASALERRAAAATDELERLAGSVAGAEEERARRAADLAQMQESAGELDAGELGLDARHELAVSAAATAHAAVSAALGAERAADQERASWTARAEALALALDRRDGAGALLAAGGDGIRGAVAALITVAPGAEAAIAAALGPRADAVAVRDAEAAAAALRTLKSHEAGRASLLVGAGPASGPHQGPPPAGARWAIELISGPEDVLAVLTRALLDVVVVADLAAAGAIVAAHPALRAATTDGDLLGADWAFGGSATTPSLLEVTATADEARTRAAEMGAALHAAQDVLAAARAGAEVADVEVAAALEALHDSDAHMAAAAERLGLLAAAESAAATELARLQRQAEDARTARAADQSALSDLSDRLAAAEAQVEEAGADDIGETADDAVREHLGHEVGAARAEELDVRLSVRTGEERVRALAGRAEQLERAAESERSARARNAAARDRRAAGAVVATEVMAVAQRAIEATERGLIEAGAARDTATGARTVAEGELLAARAEGRRLAQELETLRDAASRDEVARTEQRLRIESLEARASEEYGVAPGDLLGEYGPDRDVPPDADAGPDAVAVAYDRERERKRAAQAERQLALLGRVNPLALEEFQALEERHAFLATQLEDLKTTRRDLLGIVKEVDDHIHEVFREAYDDTAREFEAVFAILFPGGSGRLELTTPDDLMTAGIEVIARPAGKKVSRLSLLSGGERSLAAIALLVAIFRARPSPFYVMDEIEAALDDRNLQRLLECLDGLRAHSQLIVITHQKRTMEIADALYGVSMRGDGVSAVISQRLREPAAV